MKLQFTLFIILALALGASAGLLKKCSSKDDPKNKLNPYDPSATYVQSNLVNTTALELPFAGEMRTGYLVANVTSNARYFYTLYAAGGTSNSAATLNNSAPLILWLQGGPGCSDASGQFTEIAPFKFENYTLDGTIRQRAVPQEPNWNANYNLLFIDNPVGVGYSVGENVTSADDAAEYIYTFLVNFFALYPSLATNDFHVFAESFGGHYGPAIVSRILKDPNTTIKVTGLGIVDGWVHPYYQGTAYADFAYAAGLVDIKTRNDLKAKELALIQQYNNGNREYVGKNFDAPVGNVTKKQGLNPYSFRQYPNPNVTDPFVLWLRDETVKAALGVPPAVYFNDCVDDSYDLFIPNIGTSYADHYSYILSNGTVKVLVMNGADDFIVNTVGVSRFLRQLTWSGADAYNQAPKTVWFRNGTTTDEWCWGSFKHSGLLTFAIVYKAGHEVPTFVPDASIDLLERFMNNNWVQTYRE